MSDELDAQDYLDAIERGSFELDEMRADAARWRYVREHLWLHIDDRAVVTYWFSNIEPRHQVESAEVIDKLIAEQGKGGA